MRFLLLPFFATFVSNGQDLILPVAPGTTCGLIEGCYRCVLQVPDTALSIANRLGDHLRFAIAPLVLPSGPPNPFACQRRIVVTVCS